MKTCGGVGVYIHVLLTLALFEGSGQLHVSTALPAERDLGIHRMRGWRGLQHRTRRLIEGEIFALTGIPSSTLSRRPALIHRVMCLD
jgi:hypothetical protein